MSQFSQDREGEGLAAFLRQHRPCVPPAADELEDRVMQAVETLHPQPARRKLWLVSGMLAASLAIATAGYRLLTPATPSAAQLSDLEAFLVNNWNGLVNGSEADVREIEVASFLLDDLMTNDRVDGYQ